MMQEVLTGIQATLLEIVGLDERVDHGRVPDGTDADGAPYLVWRMIAPSHEVDADGWTVLCRIEIIIDGSLGDEEALLDLQEDARSALQDSLAGNLAEGVTLIGVFSAPPQVVVLDAGSRTTSEHVILTE